MSVLQFSKPPPNIKRGQSCEIILICTDVTTSSEQRNLSSRFIAIWVFEEERPGDRSLLELALIVPILIRRHGRATGPETKL